MVVIFVVGDVVVEIGMGGVVGVMIMVWVGRFDWSSFEELKKNRKRDCIVMIVRVVRVVLSDEL